MTSPRNRLEPPEGWPSSSRAEDPPLSPGAADGSCPAVAPRGLDARVS